MRAKLIINEISRDRTSAIEALGIGKYSMCEAYLSLINFDSRYKNMLTLDADAWVMNDGMRDFKKKMEEVLEVDRSHIAIKNGYNFTEDSVDFLNQNVFETEDVTTEVIELHWASSRVTEMHLTINKKKGAVYVNYIHDVNRQKYYCFRIP